MEMAWCGCSRPGTILGLMPVRGRASMEALLPSSCIDVRERRRTTTGVRVCGVRASMVDSYESSSNFVKRMEQAWLISQQPRPISCTSCNSNGHVECKWCGGTGFFIIGDNMLCQVPSRNTSCVICTGKGSKCCSDCKGTGFRAKWLGEPPIHK